MAAKINHDLTIEFASDNPAVDITRGFLGNVRHNEDKVLAQAGGSLVAYEDLYRDDRVFSTLQQRVSAVVAREYQVKPGGDSAQDKLAAEATTTMLASIKFDAFTKRFLIASLLKGYAVAEIMWSERDGMAWPVAVKVKQSQRFTFVPAWNDGKSKTTPSLSSHHFEDMRLGMRLENRLRLKTRKAWLKGEPVPARKFIVHSVGALDDDNPFGTGLGHWLYWPVRFKREGLALWLQFIDKYGSPSVKGTYPANAGEPEKRKLMDALRALRSNSVTAVPEGMDAVLIEAASRGISTHEQLMATMDEAISTIVLSQTLTTSQGSVGSQALGNVHQDVKLEVVKADADMLSDTLNDTLIYWFSMFNFPGAMKPSVVRDVQEIENLNAKAERDLKLTQATGHALDTAYAETGYGIKLGEKPAAGAMMAGSSSAAFAEGDHPRTDSVDPITDQILSEAATATDAMINQVRDLLDEVADLAEFSERLPELLGDMDTDRWAEIMTKAFAVADLTGQYEVANGN